MSILWSSLEFIAAPFRWFDAKIQLAVNSGMFALMRRGLARSAIRYALWAIAILAIVASLLIDVATHKRSIWAQVVVVFFICLLPAVQHLERHEDMATESGRTVKGRTGDEWMWRILWFYILSVDILTAAGVMAIPKELAAHPSLIRKYLWIQLTIDVAFLLILYTRRTPPKAPDKAPKPVLVSARSEA